MQYFILATLTIFLLGFLLGTTLLIYGVISIFRALLTR